MKILVIEDEVRLAEYLRKGLSESGYVVDLAHDGIDGLHLAVEGTYDLIVLDVMLPGRDGFEVCARLAASSSRPAVVLTSSRDASSYVERLAQSPARGFVAKHDLSAAALLSLLEVTS